VNSHKIYALAGYTADLGTPLYWTIPGRSVFATVSVPF
jgi:iron complex outermembrane receptor protein